jgi:diaminohydroxyphosphoribosylaminopyrimidine deaminase/5-amino-6-(5-phosphoribosylamino)uracil reductase
LRDSGIQVEVGVCEDQARGLIAPFCKLVDRKHPWLIAKWAMTLDGKTAARSGDSRWISSEESRRIAHQIRGRMDAVMVGRGTAQVDDPLLTARPSGSRTATRIVVDSRAAISDSSKLVRSVDLGPVMIAVGPQAVERNVARLRECGCEVLVCPANNPAERLVQLFDELGRREFTNVLCEGGSQLLGSLFDLRMIDEVHAFIAPKLIGGDHGISPISGTGCLDMSTVKRLSTITIATIGDDVYVKGFVN